MLLPVAHDRASQGSFRSCAGKINLKIILVALGSLTPLSAFAHHPLGGRSPETAVEGLLSGIGHPVIGIDHLAFIIAVGLLAAVTRRGLLIPGGFVLGSLPGIFLHLQLFTLPGAELLIAVSVIIFGVLLTLDKRIGTRTSVVLGATAGVFHGYAYAEAIVGANMTTLLSYLGGLTLIHLLIALTSFFLATRFLTKNSLTSYRPLRVAGVAVAGIGTAFLAFGALG